MRLDEFNQTIQEAKLTGPYRPRRTAAEKFRDGMKRAGYDMNAAAKRMQDFLDRQAQQRAELDQQYADLDQRSKKLLEDFDQYLVENLRKWFREKWVRFGPDGKIRGDCARGDDSEGKPKCLPQSQAHALGKKGRKTAASRKRREDPDSERHGPAINVKTKESQQGVSEGSEGTLWRIEKSEATGRYYVVKGYNKSRKIWKNKMGLGDFISKHDAQRKVDELNQGVTEATGDAKFDAMMANIVQGAAARKNVDTIKATPSQFNAEAMLAKFGMELITQLEKLCQSRCGPNRTMQDKPDIEPKLSKLANNNDGGEKVANILIDLYKISSVDLKEFAQAFNQQGDWSWQNFATAWTQGEWNDYKRQWIDYVGSLGKDVSEERQQCPECGGPAYSDRMLAEKQDACYHKVKSRYKVWPSAYASGALVQCRKKGAKNWGNKSK